MSAFEYSGALQAPFRDPEGVKKIVVGGLLSWLAIPIVAPLGFLHDVLQAAIEGEDTEELPELDFVNQAIHGITTLLVVGAYLLIACVPFAVVLMSQTWLIGVDKATERGTMAGGGMFDNMFVVVAGILGLVAMAFIFYWLPMALVGFIETGDLPGGFDYREIWARIQTAQPEYSRIMVLYLLPLAVFGVCRFLPGGWFAEIPVAVTGFYIAVVVLREVGVLYRTKVR